MTPDELLHMLTSMKIASQVATAIADPDLQALHGWNLRSWACEIMPKVIRFIQRDDFGRTIATVSAINAPLSEGHLFTPPPAPWPQKKVMLG